MVRGNTPPRFAAIASSVVSPPPFWIGKGAFTDWFRRAPNANRKPVPVFVPAYAPDQLVKASLEEDRTMRLSLHGAQRKQTSTVFNPFNRPLTPMPCAIGALPVKVASGVAQDAEIVVKGICIAVQTNEREIEVFNWLGESQHLGAGIDLGDHFRRRRIIVNTIESGALVRGRTFVRKIVRCSSSYSVLQKRDPTRVQISHGNDTVDGVDLSDCRKAGNTLATGNPINPKNFARTNRQRNQGETNC